VPPDICEIQATPLAFAPESEISKFPNWLWQKFLTGHSSNVTDESLILGSANWSLTVLVGFERLTDAYFEHCFAPAINAVAMVSGKRSHSDEKGGVRGQAGLHIQP